MAAIPAHRPRRDSVVRLTEHRRAISAVMRTDAEAALRTAERGPRCVDGTAHLDRPRRQERGGRDRAGIARRALDQVTAMWSRFTAVVSMRLESVRIMARMTDWRLLN